MTALSASDLPDKLISSVLSEKLERQINNCEKARRRLPCEEFINSQCPAHQILDVCMVVL